ncbi:(2Fe-2S)-binding protein [Myxococcota bacterium]|nr:(2Fe-2S)-binding protein [Myxococcota bacterium]
MIVCQCKSISHRVVDAAIEDGATTVGAIGRACGAGTICGGCVCNLKQRLAAARPRVDATAPEGAAEELPLRRHG